MISTRTANSYLSGMYAPVTDESVHANLPVRGEIPAGLRGFFLRNSPNPRFAPEGRYHWFDGDGMIHAMQFTEEGATYRNRYIQTEDFQAEGKAGKNIFSGILNPFDPGNLHPDKNTANTDLVFHDGRVIATWWLSGDAYGLSLPELNNLGRCDFGGTMKGGMSAHPKLDPGTGELMFMDFNVYRAPFLHYGIISRDGRLVHREPIEIGGARLFHDLAITENHTILLDMPLVWSAEKIARGKRQAGFRRDMPARFGILPRFGGNADIRWFETDACYIFHTINAYEEGDEIVLTGCRIENPLPETRRGSGRIPRLQFLELNPFMHRWRFHLKTGAVRQERLDDRPTEFPRMNNDLLGRKTRFSYNPKIAALPDLAFEGVIKYDERGPVSEYIYGRNRFGGEVVFAPDASGTREDDGWLTTFVYNRETDTSDFVVLDARDPAAGPVAEIPVPVRVPSGFHAWWVAEEQLRN